MLDRDGERPDQPRDLPEGLRQVRALRHVRSGFNKEEAFALPETLALAKAGKPLPPGTRLVLGVWRARQLAEYFVMEKGVNWGADFPADVSTGDWHFQQFDTSRQIRRTAFADRCQSCHSSQSRDDYLFTIDRMRAYVP